MEKKPTLLQIKHFINKQKEVIGYPVGGGSEVILKGKEVKGLKVLPDTRLVAETKRGSFYIIPSYSSAQEAMASAPKAPFLVHAGEELIINVKKVHHLNYETHVATFENGESRRVEDKYWTEFVQKYEQRDKL
ncbi:hypothetical protein [Paenibacillus sp. NPDC058177]|uniref:hypothetical protein n=1 Tax=Paenibacillus sp. NPDC058177 TaxID=3346369 RepID=UPI0036D9FE40